MTRAQDFLGMRKTTGICNIPFPPLTSKLVAYIVVLMITLNN